MTDALMGRRSLPSGEQCQGLRESDVEEERQDEGLEAWGSWWLLPLHRPVRLATVEAEVLSSSDGGKGRQDAGAKETHGRLQARFFSARPDASAEGTVASRLLPSSLHTSSKVARGPLHHPAQKQLVSAQGLAGRSLQGAELLLDPGWTPEKSGPLLRPPVPQPEGNILNRFQELPEEKYD
ncbi:Atp-Binding Cassette Sub-Family A Member 2 [Manis pentadactyla]|nr:Atp-Binding Cassette Sub-Family A Member 2 [Manis pentadactyla]